jgi:hypothetical protein
LSPVTDPTSLGDDVPGVAVQAEPQRAAAAGIPPWLTASVVAALVIVIVIASAVGVLAFTHNDGAASALEATSSMLEAVEKNDVIGIVEQLPPGERQPARDPVGQISTDLQRLHLVGIIDPTRVAGPQLRFDDLVYETHALSDEIEAVDVVGGRFTATWPGGGPPLTDSGRQILDRDFDVTVDPTGSSYQRDFGRDHLRLVAIKEGGGWHVSLAYSAAEALRQNAGAEIPEMGKGPPAIGADLPEQAVLDLVRAYADGDPERLVTLMYPDEARALYDYAPVFLPEAKAAAARANQQQTYDVQVNDVQVAVDAKAGDTRHVTITKLDVDIRDEIHKQHITWDGRCFHTDERIGDDGEPFNNTDSCEPDRPKVGDVVAPRDNPVAALDVFGTGSSPPTFTVVERNGRWFISPVSSLLSSFADTMKQLAPADVDGWADRLGATWQGGAGAGLSGHAITPTLDEVKADPSKAPERGRQVTAACIALTNGERADEVTTDCLEAAVTNKRVAVADLPADAQARLP